MDTMYLTTEEHYGFMRYLHTEVLEFREIIFP
jgi:hypothetical protein